MHSHQAHTEHGTPPALAETAAHDAHAGHIAAGEMAVWATLSVLADYLFSVAATFLFDSEVFYEASVLLLVFVLRGHWLEMRARAGASQAYNTIAFPIAAGVFYPAFGLSLRPEIGAIAMSGSSLIVAVNALLRYTKLGSD